MIFGGTDAAGIILMMVVVVVVVGLEVSCCRPFLYLHLPHSSGKVWLCTHIYNWIGKRVVRHISAHDVSGGFLEGRLGGRIFSSSY